MFTEPHFTVEIEQTMLERPVPAPQRPELLNLADDPGDGVNLSERHPERHARMERELECWFDAATCEVSQSTQSKIHYRLYLRTVHAPEKAFFPVSY